LKNDLLKIYEYVFGTNIAVYDSISTVPPQIKYPAAYYIDTPIKSINFVEKKKRLGRNKRYM
jgi:hypothetical protein